MKKKLIRSLMISAIPMIGCTQNQAKVPEGICISSPVEMIKYSFSTYLAWPLLSLFLIAIISWVIMIPIRNNHRQLARILNVALVVAIFAIWYFYPCLSFKGTYSRTVNWSSGKEVQHVFIGEKYTDGDSLYEYQLKPLRRMLRVDIEAEQSLLPRPYYPVKLGWNKIYEWDFKSGKWKKLEKVKEPISDAL